MTFFEVDVGNDSTGQHEGEEPNSDDNGPDDEENIHDQLPGVEEMKMRSNVSNGLHDEVHQRFLPSSKIFFLIGGIVLVCLLSVGGFFIAKKLRYQNAITSITTTVRISNYEAFADPKSPQSEALRWMLHYDYAKLPLPTDRSDPFVQRYIAAVFVFALIPSYETRVNFNLLSHHHECEWKSKWKRIYDYEDSSGSTRDMWTDVELGFICGTPSTKNQANRRTGEENYDTSQDKAITYHDIDNNNNNNVVAFHQEQAMAAQAVENKIIQTSITAIMFPNFELIGKLPPEIESLDHLYLIELDSNNIHGTIPAMPYLAYLELANNEMTGTIPDHFSAMTNLRYLSLAENSFHGSLPKGFGTLSDLVILALKGNDLTGNIFELYSLTKLEELNLSNNSFDHQFSNDSFQKLSNLKVLDMKNNRLSGPLPDSLWGLTNLEVIDFHDNALDGYMNNVIIPGHKLKYFDVSSNILAGGLPHSMSNLREISHIDVSYNRFTSKLSDPLSNLTQLKTLLLTENDEFGPQSIPDWLQHLTNLEKLSFRLTSRTGSIPTWFGELSKLQLLDLDWNHISGTVPTEFSRLTDLKYLMLNRNKMSGEVPAEVASLPKLKILTVDTNSFTGELQLGNGTDECPSRIKHLISDCGDHFLGCPNCDSPTQKIACPCCTECCHDNLQRCNMADHIIEIEEEYRNTYDRNGLAFDDSITYRYAPFGKTE